jgi:hypothetical protein
MRNQLALFKEAMARQDEIFQELKKVRRVGPSYKACLAEVVRRRECMKLYMGQVSPLVGERDWQFILLSDGAASCLLSF